MEKKKVLSLDYYNRLGFRNFNNWSDGDVAQFLVFDFLNAFENSAHWKKAPGVFLKGNEKIFRKYQADKFVFYPIDRILDSAFSLMNIFFTPQKRSKKVLFQSSRYKNIILEAKKKYRVGVIEQGRKDRLFFRKDFSGHLDLGYLNHLVSCYLKDGDNKHLNELLERVEKRMKIIYPDYIVLGSDIFPVERAIVLAGKRLGIKTLIIQSGLYDSFTGFIDCMTVDYVLMWGNYFKELYVKNGIRKKEDIYVLGYPYAIEKNKTERVEKTSYAVCYLGQDYERYIKELLPLKINSVKRLSEICKDLGMNFVYRPHPNDNRDFLSKELPGILFTGRKESLPETFRKADIFVGVSSTALIQSAIYSKVAIQIREDIPVNVDNFEDLGVVSKSFGSMSELKSYLGEIAGDKDSEKFKSKFNNDYIETRRNPAQRFLEIIEDISRR